VTAAISIDRLGAKLLVADLTGGVRHLPRTALASLFEPGDLVVANAAATLPASLRGAHHPSSEAIEVRLVAWVRPRDPERFIAIAFGAITVSARRIAPRRRGCAKATVSTSARSPRRSNAPSAIRG
jgi:S-adenosylmethionine:tRNA-ribosyltransferase-isomerase (queuine synthetase)